MIPVAVEAHSGSNLNQFAVDTHIEKPLLHQLLEKFPVVTLTVLYQWRQNIYLSVFILSDNQIHNLFIGIFHHFLARYIASRMPCTGIEKTEEIVYLSGGADCASGVSVDGFLFYGNHRSQAADMVYVGALEIAEHIAGIGRKSLYITPLTLCKNSIESQRRLARAA